MAKWREITFPLDKPDSAGTDPDSAGSDPDSVTIVIEDERTGVLADPLRLRVLEILGEGMTVTEISEALDVTDARVLYHVRRLAETGVVTLKKSGVDRGNWRCTPVAPAVRFREKPGNENQAEEAIPADVAEQFNQAFREAAEGMYGPSFQASVNHNRARLSEAQAAEFNRRLLALIEEYFPPGKGDRSGIKYGFYGVLTPIDLHPLGDTDSGK